MNSAVMTAVAARSSPPVRYCSFVTARSFWIVCLSPAYLSYYMRDAEMNFLVTYELDLACNVVFCIVSALR